MSETILDTIIAHKKTELLARKKQVTISELTAMPLFETKPSSLKLNLLDFNRSSIIAEFKRKSPSKGILHEHATVEEVSIAYSQFGAAGISILTDTSFFGGSLADLSIAVNCNENMPILRKEFIIDEFQIIEAKAYGAAVILLIAACLSVEEAKRLAIFAKKIGLEVLLEVHEEKELAYISDAVDFVGINNRNLNSFEVNIERALTLQSKLPKAMLSIAESGIYDIATYKLLKKEGFDGFLMGEYFMKQARPAIAFMEFMEAIKNNQDAN